MLLAGSVFLVSIAAIWVTEVAIGHPISSGSGKGTTIGEVIHGRAGPSAGPSSGGPASTGGESSRSGSGASTGAATSPAAGSGQTAPGPNGGGTATG